VKLVVGTRGSALARWQTDHVIASLKNIDASIEVEVKVITTQGDVNMKERLAGAQMEKGFFTAELEEELKNGTIDFAVHSLKDLPTRLAADFDVVATLPRANPADLLIMDKAFFLDSGKLLLPLAEGARVGTSSLRRDAMLRTHAAACTSLPLRGNVPTRVEKLRKRDYDAIVVAGAGIERLGLDLSAFVVVELDPRAWPPAPGQGAVAVEARANDPRVQRVFAKLDHEETRRAVSIERDFLRVLEGGCSTPFGCFVDEDEAYLGREMPDEHKLWVSATVHLPEEIDDQFIEKALNVLKKDPERTDDHHKLWRPYQP
jgi:hydroxymethylbilane synthase